MYQLFLFSLDIKLMKRNGFGKNKQYAQTVVLLSGFD